LDVPYSAGTRIVSSAEPDVPYTHSTDEARKEKERGIQMIEAEGEDGSGKEKYDRV
jgi:hypothetical protein